MIHELAFAIAQVIQPTSKGLDTCAASNSVKVCDDAIHAYFLNYKDAIKANDNDTACKDMLYGLGAYLYIGGDDQAAGKDPTQDADRAVSLMDEIEDNCDEPYTSQVNDIIVVVKNWKKGDLPIQVLAKNIIEGHPVEGS
jgi:hypothetical protein